MQEVGVAREHYSFIARLLLVGIGNRMTWWWVHL
jgi:hypothetical protein